MNVLHFEHRWLEEGFGHQQVHGGRYCILVTALGVQAGPQ